MNKTSQRQLRDGWYVTDRGIRLIIDQMCHGYFMVKTNSFEYNEKEEKEILIELPSRQFDVGNFKKILIHKNLELFQPATSWLIDIHDYQYIDLILPVDWTSAPITEESWMELL